MKKETQMIHVATPAQMMEGGTCVSLCSPACVRDTLAYLLHKVYVFICYAQGRAKGAHTLQKRYTREKTISWWGSNTGATSSSRQCCTNISGAGAVPLSSLVLPCYTISNMAVGKNTTAAPPHRQLRKTLFSRTKWHNTHTRERWHTEGRRNKTST